MRIDFILALAGAALSAAMLAFLFMRAVLGAAGDAPARPGGSGVRSLLAPFAPFVARRRGNDPELERTLQRLDKLVMQAGGGFLDGATAAEVFAARFVFPLLALVVILPLGVLLQLSGGIVLLLAAFFAAMLYAYPESGLKSAAAERARRFTHDLPGALDVMRLVAQSGGDLMSAIRSVIEVMEKGPVREELSRAVAEVAIGTSLAEALNNIAARVGTNEANAVFSTLAQSLEMGTSVSENLAGASQLIRHASRVKAQAQAQKAVVNMSFPLLLLILPGIFIVLFAPLIIQFINR
ncbi:MAG: type II secretion system F family protein [Kiritimatiellae bacterium]|nr:type II secretion system F family protein [Kiritimatiellia bacterium]